MRIIVAANLTPFLHGGAQEHIRGLTLALRQDGHEVECLQLPFMFNPVSEIEMAMDRAENLSMIAPSGQSVDRLIGLQFPAYAVKHPNSVGWIMHQHRAVYELYDPNRATKELNLLQEKIKAFDARTLMPMSKTARLFANSSRVAGRLKQYNDLKAQPLYHPPPLAEMFYCNEAQPYFFFPSRFEVLKRQILVIEAFKDVNPRLMLVFAGEGGQLENAKALANRLDLLDRVHFLGKISQSEKISWMANALAVLFPSFDEDYGYVTLEAMLAAKPVITCSDSGGPLEFVISDETGLVVEPTGAELSEAMEYLANNTARAREMGQSGLARYKNLGISWNRVVEKLLSA